MREGIAYFIALAMCFLIGYALYRFLRFLRHSETLAKVHWPWRLTRHVKNPVMGPVPHHTWESEGAFNPAAILLNGRVHLLYRAVGNDGVSRIGYASSADGLHFDTRLTYPVFALQNPRQCYPLEKRAYAPTLYPSGGSWGGCEDPRMVLIDDEIHLTFSAFDGWDFIRMGTASISAADFVKQEWRWSDPMLLSPTGQIHKNWVLFPEKVGGKYALMHSITPRIQIEYVDRLEDLAEGKRTVKSEFKQVPGRSAWDTWVRGVGPPPLKTPRGWLVFYHAVEKSEPHRYKIGAMLLDMHDPTIIHARTRGPLLAPDMPYENDWKEGVVYTCGAVIKDDTVFVYYGAGDKTVSVAHMPLTTLLDALERGDMVRMEHEPLAL